ncbi:MAG: hypothetical protein M1813_004212 [Trichoglossum hirsutum]|nr:MAG: hypothetical protein M1813_004212 [Trichoglossum hirsutum]
MFGSLRPNVETPSSQQLTSFLRYSYREETGREPPDDDDELMQYYRKKMEGHLEGSAETPVESSTARQLDNTERTSVPPTGRYSRPQLAKQRSSTRDSKLSEKAPTQSPIPSQAQQQIEHDDEENFDSDVPVMIDLTRKRGKKNKLDSTEQHKRVKPNSVEKKQYTFNNGKEALEIQKIEVTDKEKKKRVQEGLGFLREARIHLSNLIPPDFYGTPLDQDEIDAIDLKANCRLFPVLLANTAELRTQDNWWKDTARGTTGKYIAIADGDDTEGEDKNQTEQKKSKDGTTSNRSRRTMDYIKRADHSRELKVDCNQVAKIHDDLVVRAARGQDTTEKSFRDDIPMITTGLGRLVPLKKEQLAKNRAAVDLERWKSMERLALLSLAERLRQELSVLTIVTKRAADHLVQLELDNVALLINLRDMVRDHGGIDLQEYTIEDLLPYLRETPGPRGVQIMTTRQTLEPPGEALDRVGNIRLASARQALESPEEESDRKENPPPNPPPAATRSIKMKSTGTQTEERGKDQKSTQTAPASQFTTVIQTIYSIEGTADERDIQPEEPEYRISEITDTQAHTPGGTDYSDLARQFLEIGY